MKKTTLGLAAGLLAATILSACSGPSRSVAPAPQTVAPPGSRTILVASPAPTTDPRIAVAAGFVSDTIASVPSARELVALPNGDLLVGTSGSQLWIVPKAESAGSVPAAHPFIALGSSPAQGVAISPDGSTIYAATQHRVYKIGYHLGDQSEPAGDAQIIASVRTGGIPPGSDGDVHITTSLVVSSTRVYAGVGSSCNACVEIDPTRATVQAMHLDGTQMHTLATRIRNAMALALNPATGALWAGGAGQDNLSYRHPYEFMDAVKLQSGRPVDYGWPDCEENHVAYRPGADCSHVAIPRVEFLAYSTHIGAVFYPATQTGRYAFPAAYRGALFVTSHGSWHCCPSAPPEVDAVAMNGDTPAIPVNWSDPTGQRIRFMWNFGSTSSTNYIGRPTGIAVGTKGSLFVADDQNGAIYRIRHL